MNNKYEELGVTTHEANNSIGYFYDGVLIALENEGLLTIFPTQSVYVAEVYNQMLADNGSDLQYSFNANGSYVVDELVNKLIIDKSLSFKVKE